MTDENQFQWSQAKDGTVTVYWHARPVTTLRGASAARFVTRISVADGNGAQLLMAKVTGNFKRGNERSGKAGDT
jgi:hypothetical protein